MTRMTSAVRINDWGHQTVGSSLSTQREGSNSLSTPLKLDYIRGRHAKREVRRRSPDRQVGIFRDMRRKPKSYARKLGLYPSSDLSSLGIHLRHESKLEHNARTQVNERNLGRLKTVKIPESSNPQEMEQSVKCYIRIVICTSTSSTRYS